MSEASVPISFLEKLAECEKARYAAEAAAEEARQKVNELELAYDTMKGLAAEARQERDRLTEQIRKWADTVDEQAGRTTMTMQMHGFSPVRFMEEVRTFARAALQPTTEEAESRPHWRVWPT